MRIAFVAAFATAVHAQQYQQLWATPIHPGPKVDSLGRKSLVVDASEVAYVVDQLVVNDQDSYLTIQKFDPEGNIVSSFYYPPYIPFGTPGENWGVALALEAPSFANFIYVAGVTRTPCCGLDIQVVKFNANTGTIVWAKTMGGTANADDIPVAIEVVPNDDPIIVANVVNNGTGQDIITYRLDANTGGILWSETFNRQGVNKTDTAVDLVIYEVSNAPTGVSLEVYVAGTSYGGTDDIVVLKYRDDIGIPTQPWGGPVIINDNGANSSCSAMTVSPAPTGPGANVFVTGQSTPAIGGSQDIVTYALQKAGGVIQWVATPYDGPGSQKDYARSIALGITSGGQRLFVTGAAYVGPTNYLDLVVLEYAADTGSTLAWLPNNPRTIAGAPGQLDEGIDIISPNEDDVYVVGSSTSASGLDIITSRLRWSNGTFAWQNPPPDMNVARYDAIGGFDAALSIKAPASSIPQCAGLWVLGKSASAGGGNDTVLIRYRQLGCQ